MTMRTSGGIWTFDEFEPGAELGRVSIEFDERRLANWNAIYGSSASPRTVPSGLLVAAMMEAYLEAFQPRPPGNIHAGQKLSFAGRRVRPGARLDAYVVCIDKIFRKARRWVTFGVTLHDGRGKVLSGEIRTIWAR